MKGLLLLLIILSWNVSFGQPWFEKASFGGDARHRTTTFTIGNNGYLGFGHINSAGAVDYEDFWKYDPASDSWSQIADHPLGKCYHSTGFVIGNKAYVGTGRLTSGAYTKKFYEYDPSTNIWTEIADFPGAARRGAVSFVANNKGYVGTGQTSGGYVADFYEYDPITDVWTLKAALPGPGRTSSVAFSIDNVGYVGTGNTASGSINDFYAYLPSTNQWVLKAPVGPTNRQEAVGFAVNGFGYIGTGDDYSSGNNYGDMWEYNPTLNQWVQIEDFAGTARRYLSAFVIGSRAYAGTGTNGTNFRDFWMFDQILSVLKRNSELLKIETYPNPANEILKIRLNNIPDFVILEKITLKLTTLSGTLIKTSTLESNQTSLDVSQFPNGQYIYQLEYDGNIFKSDKIIISH